MAPAAVYSGLTEGMKIQVEADGIYYAAEVLTVSDNKKRSKAPVKVHYFGYGAENDEWVGATRIRSKALKSAKPKSDKERVFSIADQVRRFERAKKEKNSRYLDINTVYDGSVFKGKRVLLVGASKGLGLEIAKELTSAGAETICTCRSSNADIVAASKQVITQVEVTSTDALKKMADQITGTLDYVIYNAGYFPDVVDSLDSFQEVEAIKQIEICALGPVRCVSALKAAGHISAEKQPKVVIISSQAGSAKWRFTQNKGKGGDYGHHMSRAACNIACCLMSEELKEAGVSVVMLHPGFNRTTMTAKYEHIWDIEGAVEPVVGARRVLYETGKISSSTSGRFINCEDGLQIPF